MRKAARIGSFIRATRYTVDRDLGTIYGGDSPIRAISVFRVNRNDIKEGAAAEFTISDSDLHNRMLSFQGAEIQATSAFVYFQRNGALEKGATLLAVSVSLLSASTGELFAALSSNGAPTYLDSIQEEAQMAVYTANVALIEAADAIIGFFEG